MSQPKPTPFDVLSVVNFEKHEERPKVHVRARSDVAVQSIAISINNCLKSQGSSCGNDTFASRASIGHEFLCLKLSSFSSRLDSH